MRVALHIYVRIHGILRTCVEPILKIVAHQRVGVEEHAFFIIGKRPAMQLGESHSQFGATHQGQVGLILRIQHVHYFDVIVHGFDLLSGSKKKKKMHNTP